MWLILCVGGGDTILPLDLHTIVDMIVPDGGHTCYCLIRLHMYHVSRSGYTCSCCRLLNEMSDEAIRYLFLCVWQG
jgi:hypothetical protein